VCECWNRNLEEAKAGSDEAKSLVAGLLQQQFLDPIQHLAIQFAIAREREGGGGAALLADVYQGSYPTRGM